MSDIRSYSDTLDTIIKVLNNKDGKDKTLKLIQYTGKLILRAGDVKQVKPTFDYYKVATPISPLVSQFSSFRKVIRLGNWLTTARDISKDLKHTRLIDYIDLYTEIFDDLYLLAKIGVICSNAKTNKKWIHIFDREAIKGWYLAILFNLYSEYKKRIQIETAIADNADEKKSSEIYQARWMSTINILKLICDFIFCSIDVFEIDADASVQIISGLASGIFGYYKIYKKM